MASSNASVSALKRTFKDREHERENSQNQAFGLPRSLWGRFTSYILVEGVIVRSQSSRWIEYDPFSDELMEKPHTALYNLIKKHKITFYNWNQAVIAGSLQDDILAWCQSYGLLGLLPSRLLEIRMWPLWTKDWDNEWHAAFHSVIKQPMNWAVHRMDRPLTTERADEGEPLCAEDAKRSMARHPEFPRVIQFDGHHYTSQTPEESGIRTYFPKIDNTDAGYGFYPIPGSDAFWQAYGEPITEFLANASRLVLVMDEIQAHLSDESCPLMETLSAMAFSYFNQNLAGLHPFLERTRTNMKFRDSLACHSLLQSICRMIQVDAYVGTFPRTCPNCLIMFHSTDSRKRYCGKRCQDQFKVKAFRARQKEAQEAKRADKATQPKGRHGKQQ
jgi:hypothetical protein